MDVITPTKIIVSIVCPSCQAKHDLDITDNIFWDRKTCICCQDEVFAVVTCPGCNGRFLADITQE